MKIKKILVLLMTILLGIFLCSCGGTAAKWQEPYDLGIRYLSEGNYEEAIIAFTAAIEIDPKQAPAYVGRGDAYIGSGETEETLAAAQADYETAVELDETNAQAYLGLADVYIRQGEFDKAREVLEIGFEKTGDQSISAKLEEFDGGSITDSSGLSRRATQYDADGNVLFYEVTTYRLSESTPRCYLINDVTTYDPDGNQIDHGQYVYDEQENMVESYSAYINTGELGRTIRDYDENGNVVIYEDFEPDGTKTARWEWIYNDQHQIIKEYYWDRSDIEIDGPPRIWAYTYDAAGNQTEEITCDINGEPLYVSERRSYDSNGNKTEVNYYGRDGDWNGKRVFEYNDFGDTISDTIWNSDGTIDRCWETSYEYDDDGNKIGATYYQNGEILYTTKW